MKIAPAILVCLVLSLHAAPDSLSADSAATDTALVDTLPPDSTLPDTSGIPDSTLADSADADSLGPELMRAGRRETQAIEPAGKHCLGPHFTFMIPIVREFEKIRSDKENQVMNTELLKDAEEKFEENDISFPLGITFRRRLNQWIDIQGAAAFFRIKNSAKWTPREGDTLYTRDHHNSYEFRTVQISVEPQVSISRAILTADKFSRIYLGFMGECFPYIRMITKRTELKENISCTGFGFGTALWVGLERYLNERASFTGAVGYGLGKWYHFKEKILVRNSDIFKEGNDEEFDLGFRSLRFRFAYCRWF